MNGDHPSVDQVWRDLEKAKPVNLVIDASTVFAVIGNLQLALRHPGNRGLSSEMVAGVVQQLIDAVGITPAIRQVLEAGNDPRRDGPVPAMEGRAAVRPTIVCLCGSTRFWREFQCANLRETLCGRIVLSIGAATATDDEHFGNLPREEYDRVKVILDELHLRKIDLADEVLILDAVVPWCGQCEEFRLLETGCRGGHGWAGLLRPYIGQSTRRELEYARSMGKRVRFLSSESNP